jgi:2-polyprenyl-3-methyl-5-hydroxy-6-metoxy-1,4-benzoquinol methylase
MTTEKTYIFKEINKCNMCGFPVSSHKILGRRLNGSQGSSPHKKTGLTTTILQCRNCSLIFSNPLPIPLNLQDHYGIPPEEYWKNSYFTVDPDYFLPIIDQVKELMTLERGMKTLDIGAGLGKAMKSMESEGFDAYGIEPSVPFYERAIEKMQISKNRLQLAAIEDAEFPDNFFDFITFGAVLEHLYDPNDSIRKALKWLKPGGVIHIEVPSSDWLTHKIINIFYKIRGLDYVGNLSPMHEPFHLYEFGLKSFQLNGKNLGYDVVRHDYYVCQTFLPKQLDFILKPYMAKTNKGMQLCVYLKKK